MGNRGLIPLSVIVLVLFVTIGLTQDSYGITDIQIKEMFKENDYTTKPTFGLSHENGKKVVDKGFVFNNKTFVITDNYHTPFPEQEVEIGEVNTFEAKVFADHGLRVQEFIFGIPEKGEAHQSELFVEVWYDTFGKIQDVNVVQKSNVIDVKTIEVFHEKSSCTKRDSKQSCDNTKISMVFLEPLQDKIMAIKAIDNLNRYQITYLNEGFDVSGESLNPMTSMMIPSNVRNEGLIKVTQFEKYSSHWIAEDGRIFEQNKFGSFKQINQEFERFQDSGDARTRYHSGFGERISHEQDRAAEIFDASKLIKESPQSEKIPLKNANKKQKEKFGERITAELKEKMFEIEKECLEYLKESDKQTRNY